MNTLPAVPDTPTSGEVTGRVEVVDGELIVRLQPAHARDVTVPFRDEPTSARNTVLDRSKSFQFTKTTGTGPAETDSRDQSGEGKRPVDDGAVRALVKVEPPDTAGLTKPVHQHYRGCRCRLSPGRRFYGLAYQGTLTVSSRQEVRALRARFLNPPWWSPLAWRPIHRKARVNILRHHAQQPMIQEMVTT